LSIWTCLWLDIGLRAIIITFSCICYTFFISYWVNDILISFLVSYYCFIFSFNSFSFIRVSRSGIQYISYYLISFVSIMFLFGSLQLLSFISSWCLISLQFIYKIIRAFLFTFDRTLYSSAPVITLNHELVSGINYSISGLIFIFIGGFYYFLMIYLAIRMIIMLIYLNGYLYFMEFFV